MKKLLFIILAAFSLTVFAQQKPKLAVYMTGDDPINEIVSSRLVDDFARSNEYTTVERTTSFLAELNKEHAYERTGDVDDAQIAALGRQFNVNYICVTSVLDVWGSEKYISARIIDAETAEVVASGSSNGSIQNSGELIGALNTLSDSFLRAMRSAKQNDAKKVAVYVTKTGNRDVDVVLGDQLVSGFARSGKYVAIERTNGFLKKLKEEQGYQQSGAVDDNDLTRWGQQFGVQYVCVIKSTAWSGDYFITTRMIDVKTGEVVNSCKIEGAKLNASKDVVQVAHQIAAELSKGTFEEQRQQEAEKQRVIAERQAQLQAEREAQAKAETEKKRKAEQRLNQRKVELEKIWNRGYIVIKTSDGVKMMLCLQPIEVTGKEVANGQKYSKYGFSDWEIGLNEDSFSPEGIFGNVVSVERNIMSGSLPEDENLYILLINEYSHYFKREFLKDGYYWERPIIMGHYIKKHYGRRVTFLDGESNNPLYFLQDEHITQKFDHDGRKEKKILEEWYEKKAWAFLIRRIK